MYLQINLHYSRYFFYLRHTLSLSPSPAKLLFFFSDAFHLLPAVARTIKIPCVINKTITHRNPFARSADVNRRSILHARSAEAYEGRKEGRKRDTVTIISGTDVRGNPIIIVSVTFVWPTKRPMPWRFIYSWHHHKNIVHFVAGQYLCSYHSYLCSCKPCTTRIIQRNHHATGIIWDNYP